MALETGTYISDLVATNPVTGDGVNQGDDHIRLLKATVKATFPNITGAVTPTHTELNYVDGVTSAIQTQLDAKVASSSFPNVAGAVTPTHTELNYVDGVTSAIQTQLDAKVDDSTFPNVAGAVTPTHTELNYVDGVTSAIQTQLDAKAPIASPTFTGTPAAPTAAPATNTTQVATTAFVTAAVAALDTGGVDILGNIDTSSGTSFSLGSLVLTDYKMIRLLVRGMGASTTNTLMIGNSTSDDVGCSVGKSTAGSTVSGIIDIDLADGVGCSALGDSVGGSMSWGFDSAITTASTTITMAWSGGNTGTAGSVRVIGIK